MSDAKSKSAEETHTGNPFIDAIFWLMLVLVVYATVKGFLDGVGFSFDFIPSITSIFASVFGTIQVFSVFLSLLFVVGIIYFNIKLGEVLHHGHGDHHGDHAHAGQHPVPHAPDKRWLSIQSRLSSGNDSDWRLAIIESDIILDEMLGRMGYVGDNIADKLKMVEKSDFNTIDIAWEAHKVRNRVAHDGSDFKLSKQEAERVVGLYQKVFEEFHFI